jgi:hypothetical protein
MGDFASRKRKADDESRASTRLRTTQVEDCQKKIRMSEPSPPTPTKESLIQLPRATRHTKPCCLHFGIDKGARAILYPDYFFCGNCEAYVEAMLHSSRKALIKKDSLNFICQADHKNFIFPTTKKSDRIHHTLLKRFEEVKEDSEQEDDQVAVVASTPPEVARPLPTITPASSRRPFLDPTRQSTVTPPAVLPLRNDNTICQTTATPPVPIRNLQRDIDSVPANQNQQDYKRKYEEKTKATSSTSRSNKNSEISVVRMTSCRPRPSPLPIGK